MSDQDEMQMASHLLNRLLGYLAADPDNVQLLSDAATAAESAGRYQQVDELLARLERIQQLLPWQQNQKGLSFLSQGRFEEARDIFSGLMANHSDSTVSYNLAYAQAMLGEYQAAVDVLSPKVLHGEARAIPLRMSCLHHLGQVDEAIAIGETYANHTAVGPEVCGHLANLFFDLGQIDLAKHYAEKHPDEPGSLALCGLLSLENGDDVLAETCFAKALTLVPAGGRANVGEGLRQFKLGHFEAAAAHLDKGAAVLIKHAGSWLSAGWAHLLAGKPADALERFERASKLDRGFAEAWGAQAMACYVLGRVDDADRLSNVARRLDPDCLAAMKVASLLADRVGDHETSEALEKALLETSPGRDGRKLADLLGLYRKGEIPTLTRGRVN